MASSVSPDTEAEAERPGAGVGELNSTRAEVCTSSGDDRATVNDETALGGEAIETAAAGTLAINSTPDEGVILESLLFNVT